MSPDAGARLATAAPRPAWRAWIEILLCSGYPTQIALGYALQGLGLAPVRADGALNASFIFALSLADTVLLLSLIVFLLMRRGERPARVFFGDAPPVREAAAGVLSLPLVMIIVVALMLAIRQWAPSLHNVPENPLESLLGTQAGLLVFLVVVIVAGGIREELQRAFLLHRFRSDLGQPWMGVFITSLAFGLGHTLQGLDAAVVTGTLGALWGTLYLVRGSAVAPVVSHSLFNSSELLRVFLR
jgi:membrane protease YdiL (CAAX protease family)